jgi:hypothetical protein
MPFGQSLVTGKDSMSISVMGFRSLLSTPDLGTGGRSVTAYSFGRVYDCLHSSCQFHSARATIGLMLASSSLPFTITLKLRRSRVVLSKVTSNILLQQYADTHLVNFLMRVET